LNPQHSLIEDIITAARLVWELLQEPQSNEQMAASLADRGRSDIPASRWMRLMADAQVLAHEQQTHTYRRKATSFG
jgi:hypothetical protein